MAPPGLAAVLEGTALGVQLITLGTAYRDRTFDKFPSQRVRALTARELSPSGLRGHIPLFKDLFPSGILDRVGKSRPPSSMEDRSPATAHPCFSLEQTNKTLLLLYLGIKRSFPLSQLNLSSPSSCKLFAFFRPR